ncbi:MAG: serine/threonine-protein phosphatase [Elusimicrobia bacterium]|nr:serine/threonine-protein phosphatase [Elusimicrobiota bacterium]
MELKIGVRCDIGPFRKENQDGFLVSDFQARWSEPSGAVRTFQAGPRGVLLAVADGMGGHKGGREAADLALSTLLASMQFERGRPPLETLQAAVESANAALHERGQREAELADMGTTLTVAWACEGVLYVAQVGDSRAYLLRGGRLERLTTDHSAVEKIFPDAPPERRNILAQSVCARYLGLIVELSRVPLREGDVVLLCSDGLHGVVSDDGLRDALGAADADRAASELLRTAVRGDTKDNVTALVARVSGGLPPPAGSTLERVVDVEWDADAGRLVRVPRAPLVERPASEKAAIFALRAALLATCAGLGIILAPRALRVLAPGEAPPQAAPPPPPAPEAPRPEPPRPRPRPASRPKPVPAVDRSTATVPPPEPAPRP